MAFSFHALEIRSTRQATRLWEGKRICVWHISIDLTLRGHIRTFVYSKSLPTKSLAGRPLQANDGPRLRRRRRSYVDIGVRLRFSLRLGLGRWSFLYDRCIAFLLLGWRICDRGFLLFARSQQCQPS